MTITKPPVDPIAVAKNPEAFTDDERMEAIDAVKKTTLEAIQEIQQTDFATESAKLNKQAIIDLANLRKQIKES